MFVTILTVGLLVFAAHLFTALFEKARIPDVLLLMLLGIVAGPLLHLVEPADFGLVGPALTTIALIVILFEGGTTLDIPTIVRSAGHTLSLTLATFIVTAGITAVMFVTAFGVSPLIGLILGGIIGGTSSAVVVPMVRGLKMKDPAGTVLVLESSLTDVLCIVLVYALLEATVSEATSTGRIVGTVLSALVFAGVIGILGGHLWLLLLKRVRRFPNTVFTTFAFIFILYGISEMLGYSGAITALAFGITLTNFRFFRFDRLPFLRSAEWESISATERAFYGEIVFLLKVFFFVYLGILIRFDDVGLVLFAVALVAVIYAARIVITKVVLPKHVDRLDAAVVSVMIPKGLAAAVLASLPLQYGVPEAGMIQSIVYTVVPVSIVLTAVLVSMLDRIPLFPLLFRSFAAPRSGDDGAARTES